MRLAPIGMMRALFAICVFAVAAQGGIAAEEEALSNAEIVALAKAGLNAEVLLAKIEAATTVDFDLSSNALVALKKDGVPQAVIAAMLKRESSARTGGGLSSAVVPAKPAAPWQVRLVTGSSTVDLIRSVGSVDFAALGMSTFCNFSGAAAQTRTHDRQPTLALASSSSPNGQYFLVKTKPNAKKGLRVVKIGAGMMSMRDATTPNKDWTIAYVAFQQEPGIWRLQLAQPLEPGEYGLYQVSQNQLAAGDIYDFAVDP